MENLLQYTIDIDNEQSILSNIIQQKKFFDIFNTIANHNYFLTDDNKFITYCLTELYNKNLQYSLDTILMIAKTHNINLNIKYIMELIKIFPVLSEANFREHIYKLKDDYIKQLLREKEIPDILEKLYNPKTSTDKLIKDIKQITNKIEKINISDDIEKQTMFSHFKEYALVEEQRLKNTFYTTGFINLDKHLIRGLYPLDMTIIAGRPSMGKSAFVTNMALRLSNIQIPVFMFSIEMTGVSIIDRLLSVMTNISLYKIIKDRKSLTPKELQLLNYQKEYIRNSHYLFIDDSKYMTLDIIKKRINFIQNKYGYTYMVVIIDLIDRLADLRTLSRKISEPSAYAEILNQIKIISQETKTHFIIVNQINRSVETKKDKHPQLWHLKGSGAFEQYADMVLLLYRNIYYTKKNIENNNEDILEINLAKQRDGSMNPKIEFLFIGETVKVLPIVDEKDLIDYDDMDDTGSQNINTNNQSFEIKKNNVTINKVNEQNNISNVEVDTSELYI